MKKNLVKLVSVEQIYRKGKILRIMKLTSILVFCTVFTLLAENTHSQNTKVTIHKENAALQDVLNEIEEQTEYLFLYNKKNVDVNTPTTIHANSLAVTEVLNSILKNTKVNYEMVGSHIVLSDQVKNINENTRTITGKVLDEDGYPIIGANIMEKGSASNGTVTDIDGLFSIAVPENAVLQVTYIGYIEQEIRVGAQSNLTIILIEDSKRLDEVVVVGYGIQKKVNLTGSVASVNVEEKLQGRPIGNISSGLSGLVAGLDVRQSSGQPGKDDATINIRGIGTLNNSSPMILIDGIVGSMNDVNPSDIENISVLKDASSASIYGSRAANGVILITTKKGNKGRVKIAYSGMMSRQEATNLFDVISDYATTAKLTNEGYNNVSPGNAPVIPLSTIEAWENNKNNPLLYPNTNWLDAIFRPTWRKENNVSISGGGDALVFNLGLGILNNEGIMKGTGFDRYNLKLNLESNINKWIKVGLNANVQFNNMKEAYESGYMMHCLADSSPSTLPQHPDGRFGGTMAQGEDNQGNNMLAFNDGRSIKVDGTRFMGKMYVKYEPIKNLILEANYALNYNYSFNKTQLKYTPMWNFQTESIIRSPFPENILNQITMRERWKSWGGSAQYEFTIADDHNFKVLAGGTAEEFRSDYSLIGRGGMPDFEEYQINLSTSGVWAGGWAEEWSLVSFFGRINYDYMGKYLFEANLRADGSSRFSKNNRWGYFPSFSVGWRASEESFIKDNIEFINNLKLRGSYGSLGNNNIGNNYTFANMYGMGNHQSYVLGQAIAQGAAASGIPNKEITWEETKITNIGIDFSFLQNFEIVFDVFQRKTEGILINAPLPGVLGGLNAPYQNLATVKNKGWELTLNYNKRVNKDLSLGGNFNISHVSNKIEKYRGGEPVINNNTIIGDGYRYGDFYGYVCEGIFRTQEDIDNHAKQVYGNALGDLKYKDINNDGVVNEEDRTVIGKSTPDYVLGLNLNARYKNLDFSVLFQSLLGYEVWYKDNWDRPTVGRGRSYRTKWLGRWTPENPNASLPRLTADYQGNDVNSDFWLQNANYVRLKNLQVGYTFPSYPIFQQIGVEHLRIFVSADNLFTITKFDGLDPETAAASGQRYETEVILASNHPNARLYTFGLNLIF